jgi:hypothetical protein
MKLRLVDDWHQAWKWSSIRLMGLSGTAELALRFFKDLPTEVTQFIDPKVLSYIATGAFVLAFLGRLTQVEKHDDVQPPKPS